MKNLIFIISIVLLVSQFSCEKRYPVPATRIIHNETNHAVEVKLFYTGQIVEEIAIPSSGADTMKMTCTRERGRLLYCDIIPARISDSVQVVFDNQRSFTYCGTLETCMINNKNIMALNVEGENNTGYVETSPGVFVFTFTEDDYNIAEPISGN